MAATDAKAIPVKNSAYRVTFPIFDADGDLVTGATGLDSEVSIDGGTFADCTNEATEIATSSGMYYLDLTSSEMNGDTIAIIIKTSSSGAKPTPIVLYTAARSINDLAYPTTTGRSIDVTAGGEVGIDWANIGSPTTTVNLSGTTVKTATDVETDTADIQSRLPAALTAGGNIKSDALAVNGSTTNANLLKLWLDGFETGTAQAGAAGTITLAAGASSNILRNSAVKILSGTGAGQTRGISAYNTGTKIATIYPSWGTNPDNTSVYLIIPMMGEVSIEAVQRDTDVALGLNTFGFDYGSNGFAYAQVVSMDNDTITSGAIAASAVTEIQSGLATAASIAALNNLSAAQVNTEVVDALAVDVIADSVATDGNRPTIAQALLMISRFLMEKSVSGTTVTVKKEDGSTTSMTFTLNDATSPTSITRAS